MLKKIFCSTFVDINWSNLVTASLHFQHFSPASNVGGLLNKDVYFIATVNKYTKLHDTKHYKTVNDQIK